MATEDDNKIHTVEKEGEKLRLEGNDAFSTKDWERALSLYQQSVKRFQNAKTFANMAATMCKLGRYEEATEAAKRASVLDPSWAKGWWRRGIVAELHKEFVHASQYFSLAVKLDPKTAGFRKSLKKAEKRLGLSKPTADNPHGLPTMDPSRFNQANFSAKGASVMIPTKEAYSQIKNEIGGSPHFMLDKFRRTQESSNFQTSKQFLFQGILQFIGGLQTAIGSLCLTISPQARNMFGSLAQQYAGMNGSGSTDTEPMSMAFEHALGGVPDCVEGSNSFDNMVSGYAYLGGKLLFLENAHPDDTKQLVCPQPAVLRGVVGFQAIAILRSIDSVLEQVLAVLGPAVKFSPAVLHASKGFWANIGEDYPHKIKEEEEQISPEECVEYVKYLLSNGVGWDNGVRRYVALQYKGSIMYGFIVHMMSGLAADSYKWEKWAIDFITLLDDEFAVKEEKSYEEKGSSFRDSLQIGILMAHFQKHEVLRADAIEGAYPMNRAMNMCIDISKMANNMEVPHQDLEYYSSQWKVACVRKPLAMAHGAIGSMLNILREIAPLEDFLSIVIDCELIDEDDEDTDPFVLIASHYKIAAENELQDAADAPIYWWAYGGNMARSDPKSGFTLGMLRDAMKKARTAEESRDITIFGVDNAQGGSYRTLVTRTAHYFRDKEDSFVLPKTEILDQRGEGKGCRLKVSGEVVCADFEHSMEKRYLPQEDEGYDITEIENEHGQEFSRGVPSLETLCIRELHKNGCEYAKGENDGSIIQYKAMMAMSTEE